MRTTVAKRFRIGRHGLAVLAVTIGLMASPVAPAGVVAVSEADVTITVTSISDFDDPLNTDFSDLFISASFSSTETEALNGSATGFASASSTLNAAVPGQLALGDSLHIAAIASGEAGDGGSFRLESDGRWVFTIENRASSVRAF